MKKWEKDALRQVVVHEQEPEMIECSLREGLRQAERDGYKRVSLLMGNAKAGSNVSIAKALSPEGIHYKCQTQTRVHYEGGLGVMRSISPEAVIKLHR